MIRAFYFIHKLIFNNKCIKFSEFRLSILIKIIPEFIPFKLKIYFCSIYFN